MRPARRLADLVQSDIRRMTRECERASGINLGQGICDLPTPPLVRDGAIAAIRANQSIYSFAEGARELRDVIAAKLRRDNGIEADPASEICVTVGASGAYASTINALLDPGDGILFFEPYYGYHLNAALVAGLTPQFVTLSPPDFALTEASLRAALTERTRALVLCTPSNPSGKMFTREELQAVARAARERDLLVITDEIYEYIRYDGRPHVSPATVDGLRERTVSIMGLSKTFSITGWRLGYTVAPAELTRAITLVNDLYYVCAPTPLQLGAAAGFNAPQSYFDDLQSSYQKKRDAICAALSAAALRPIVPQGAYYVLADCSALGFATAREAAMHLLETKRVASIPGTAFYRGSAGEKLLRFCFAKDDDVLDEACRRLRAEGPASTGGARRAEHR
ncbi:MAG TPA: pyridoxal phosphate-dependent aminotransferase [Myxococcales bacterium]|nr:pyridoxal phosphate-dependent aminotransferase [Myxococcales bacterium]